MVRDFRKNEGKTTKRFESMREICRKRKGRYCGVNKHDLGTICNRENCPKKGFWTK